MVISFLNQKGGVGKTTLSLNIAHTFSLHGIYTMVIEADPQDSILNWSSIREDKPPFDIMSLPTKYIHRDIKDLCKKYPIIIIDGPPRSNDIVRSCIMASDIVIIPCTPSPYDIWSSLDTVQLIDEAKIYKPNLKSYFAINRRIKNTSIESESVNALLKTKTIVLKSHITQRVSFAEAVSKGLTVIEDNKDIRAIAEISSLYYEILQEIDQFKCTCNEK